MVHHLIISAALVWANYFPKCVGRNDVDVTVQQSESCGKGQLDPIGNRSSSLPYLLVRPSGEEDETADLCHLQADSSAFLSSTIETKDDCQPCNDDDDYGLEYKTCGSEDSYSVYCQGEECQTGTEATGYYVYYGCYELEPLQPPTSPNENALLCLDTCKDGADPWAFVTEIDDDGTVSCECKSNGLPTEVEVSEVT